MQWFFALTEDSTAFRQYAEMIMVAVHTAKKFTSLEPHCIYDGGENEFTEWLAEHEVRIVRHRSFVREQLEELGRQKGNPHLAAALSGAFSRVELPELVERTGGADRVLYTDCDVIFLGEVVPELEANPCEYFAVAPESSPGRLREHEYGGDADEHRAAPREPARSFASTFRKTWPSSNANPGMKRRIAGFIATATVRSGIGSGRN